MWGPRSGDFLYASSGVWRREKQRAKRGDHRAPGISPSALSGHGAPADGAPALVLPGGCVYRFCEGIAFTPYKSGLHAKL
eukprot:5220848-Prymnesium_polylepis.1